MSHHDQPSIGVFWLIVQETDYLGLKDSAASASRAAGTIGACHRALIFVFLVDRFCHVGQASLKLMTSDDLPASASQSAGITGVSHHARPRCYKVGSSILPKGKQDSSRARPLMQGHTGESANTVPHYHKLFSQVSHIWRNHRGQHIRSAMDKPRPGKTTFVIMVSPPLAVPTFLPFPTGLGLGAGHGRLMRQKTQKGGEKEGPVPDGGISGRRDFLDTDQSPPQA
ncbi:hypothetical protein AAY473_039461 [Plecturocebus cupreus]